MCVCVQIYYCSDYILGDKSVHTGNGYVVLLMYMQPSYNAPSNFVCSNFVTETNLHLRKSSRYSRMGI